MSHVGYRSNAKQELSGRDYAIAGAVSGVVTRAIAHPLDVVKIRFQLQVEPVKKRGGGLYQGLFQSVGTILRMEGIRGLWRGHVPAQALSFTFGMAQFWSFAMLTKTSSQFGLGEGFVSRGMCGAASGVCATLASFPFDIVRTRLIAQGFPKRYNGVLDGLAQMIRKEGPLSVWRGIIPTLLMSAPYSGLTFYFYNIFTTLGAFLLAEAEHQQRVVSIAAVSGTGAGICAKMCIYPLDVLKKRLQIRGFEEARKQFGKVVVYPSAWKVIRLVTLEEGVFAWFKGLWPSLIKSGCSTGLIFVSYEATCQFLHHIHHKSDRQPGDSGIR